MDIPLFLKTYAVNLVVGMWDDYWANGNNFYFYFAPNGKAYFIPYDYYKTTKEDAAGDAVNASVFNYKERLYIIF